jgi:hypothetical protein
VRVQQRARLVAEAAQDASAVGQQVIVRRIRNVRFDHGAVGTQFAALRHLPFVTQPHQPSIERLQGGGAHQSFTVAQRTMVRDRMVVDSAEPAPFGAADQLVVQSLVAPAHQVAQHVAAERHLDGRRGAAIPGRLWGREQEILRHSQDQLAIVEQLIHLHQLGIELELERNPCQEPFVPRICYNQHRASCASE